MLTSIRQFLLLVPLILILAAAIVRPAGAGSMEARPGDMVVCLGAGTISAWANALPARLQGRAA